MAKRPSPVLAWAVPIEWLPSVICRGRRGRVNAAWQAPNRRGRITRGGCGFGAVRTGGQAAYSSSRSLLFSQRDRGTSVLAGWRNHLPQYIMLPGRARLPPRRQIRALMADQRAQRGCDACGLDAGARRAWNCWRAKKTMEFSRCVLIAGKFLPFPAKSTQKRSAHLPNREGVAAAARAIGACCAGRCCDRRRSALRRPPVRTIDGAVASAMFTRGRRPPTGAPATWP